MDKSGCGRKRNGSGMKADPQIPPPGWSDAPNTGRQVRSRICCLGRRWSGRHGGLSTTTPWVGRGPASWAALTAKTAAETERSLGDEAAGPLANLVTYPQDGGDGEDDDPLAMLKTDIAGARGKALLVETTSAGLGEGRASAPQRDWVPQRLGPEPPDAMVTSVDAAFARMVAACGSTISLFNDSDGTSQREALRRWHMSTVRPLSGLLAAELTTKLDTPSRVAIRRIRHRSRR